MLRFSWWVIGAFNILILAYFVTLNLVYLGNSILAFGALRRQARKLKIVHIDDLVTSAGALPVTVLIPSFNEEANGVEVVRATLAMKYADFEVLLVNDGSTDGTLKALIGAFDMVPASRMRTSQIPTRQVRGIYHSRKDRRFWLVDKENGGKPDALNAGLNHCQTPLYCAIDSDTLLERDALTRLTRPFLEDQTTIASGGIVRIANGCVIEDGVLKEVRMPRSLLARLQVLEYLRAFLSGRMAWEVLDATLIISGALGLFRRDRVVEAGAYNVESIGEDMELVVRLHRFCHEKGIPYRLTYVPDPVAWTECPEDLWTLGRQRDRWQRGLMDSLARHRTMLFNPNYGKVGMLAFPYFYFLEMLGPVVELCGYLTFTFTIMFGESSTLYLFAFGMVAVVLGIALSMASIVLEELSFRRYPRILDLLHLFALAVIENLGYRQLATYWRFRGIFSALLRRKSWGRMERKGLAMGTS